MTGKMICFDMDGTIADLYGVTDWLMKIRIEDATPYRKADPLVDMEELRNVLLTLSEQGWEIRVISWLAKDSRQGYKGDVRRAKREWLKQYNFPFDKAHFVQYGTSKAGVVRYDCSEGILIDDSKEVRDDWWLGETIDPAENDIIETLRKLIV